MASLVAAAHDPVVAELVAIKDETRTRLLALNARRDRAEAELEMLVEDLRSPRGPHGFVAGLPGVLPVGRRPATDVLRSGAVDEGVAATCGDG